MELTIKAGFAAGFVTGLLVTIAVYGVFAVVVGFIFTVKQQARDEARSLADFLENTNIARYKAKAREED